MKYVKRFKTNDDVLRQYENEAPEYDKNRSSHEIGRNVDEIQLEFIQKLIKKYDKKVIMEAGCGTGRLLYPLYMSDKRLNCYGCDLSPNMLGVLKQKTSKIETKVCSIDDLDYENETFDFVYTMHVIMHLTEGFYDAFHEMHRITKNGGIVVLDFPNASSIWNKLSVLLNPNKGRTNLYTIKELRKYFSNYEYEIKGLFSYPRSLYKFKILQPLIRFMEKHIPLGKYFCTQTFVVIVKGGFDY